MSVSMLLEKRASLVADHLPDVSSRTSIEELLLRYENHEDVLLQERDTEAESRLRGLAAQLLARVDVDAQSIQRIWFERLLRVGLPLMALLVLAVGLKIAHDQSKLLEETTIPWRASSRFVEPGCISPRQGCEQDHFFFHTRTEAEPWIEFDLGDKGSVSKVTVMNRTDCHGCSARAVPLVIEVSDDRKNWAIVARREADFATWRAQFPRQKARWLRLRVLKRTPFHLKQVRIER